MIGALLAGVEHDLVAAPNLVHGAVDDEERVGSGPACISL